MVIYLRMGGLSQCAPSILSLLLFSFGGLEQEISLFNLLLASRLYAFVSKYENNTKLEKLCSITEWQMKIERELYGNC